ncbi:MAG: drug/metabolite exporter YedA [Flammeovirgaceae bacterium]
MSSERRYIWIAMFCVCFFWGTTYLALRIGVKDVPGLYFAGIRNFLAGLALTGFYLMKGHQFPSWETLKKLALISFLLLVVSNGMMSWSMQFITSGLGAIIAAMTPLWIAIFSMILLQKNHLPLKVILGLLIGFTGISGIFYDNLADLFNPSFRLGIILALGATMSWSLGAVITSKQKPDIHILFGTGIQMLFAGVVLLIISIVTGNAVSISSFTISSWYALIYLITFGSLIGYGAFVYAVSKLPPAKVSIYAYINPIVALFLGWLILHEDNLNPMMGIGSFATLLGVYLVNSGNKK